jgi:proteic killer suppression protein
MKVRFANDALDRLETDVDYEMGLGPGVVRAYRTRLQAIRAALDERDFYALKSLHFEKLKGKRKHQHSMRLNKQLRLVVELQGKGQSKVVLVVGVEDYH